jgi:hypothetical protein
MKLIELIDSLSEDETIHNAVGDILNAITLEVLLDYRNRKIQFYEAVKRGVNWNCYAVNDCEEDAFEISRRIEAVDIIIDEFCMRHRPYDFDAVESDDDKEDLS